MDLGGGDQPNDDQPEGRLAGVNRNAIYYGYPRSS